MLTFPTESTHTLQARLTASEQARHEPPTIFVVDDDPIVRHHTEHLLQTLGFSVITFKQATDFLYQYPMGCPGCLLLDVRLPTMSGLVLQEKLRHAKISLPIIFMTAFADNQVINKALKGGAFELLLKPLDEQALLEAVNGAIALDSKRRCQAMEQLTTAHQLSLLSPRECDYLVLFLAGRPEGKHTNFRRKIKDKMQVSSFAGLIEKVARYQLRCELDEAANSLQNKQY